MFISVNIYNIRVLHGNLSSSSIIVYNTNDNIMYLVFI